MVLTVLEVILMFLEAVLVVVLMVPLWMSFILPVTGKKQVQELRGRPRTIRSITGMIRSSSWTTLKRVLRGLKEV